MIRSQSRAHHEPVVRLFDNPILRAQRRRSLRGSSLLKACFVPLALGVCGLVAGRVQIGPLQFRYSLKALLFLCGAVLFLRATSRLSSLMANERNSGMLEFHQATPTTGWTDALGYLFGGGVRQYLTTAVLFPFILVASLMTEVSVITSTLAVLVLLSTAITYQLLAMLLGLIGGKRGFFGSLATGLPILLVIFGGALSRTKASPIALLTPYPALADLGIYGAPELSQTYVFGVEVNTVLLSLGYHLVVSFFLLWAIARKLRRTDATLFSRPGAIALFSLLSGLLVSDLHRPDVFTGRLFLFSYLTMSALFAVLAIGSICPTLLSYTRRLRRIETEPNLRHSVWDDDARVWPTVAVIAGVWCVQFYFASFRFGDLGVIHSIGDLQTVNLVGQYLGLFVFSAAVFEFAFFDSRRPTLSTLGLSLLVFVVVPWLFFASSHTNQSLGFLRYAGALSPTFGAVFSSTFYLAPLSDLPITDGLEYSAMH